MVKILNEMQDHASNISTIQKKETKQGSENEEVGTVPEGCLEEAALELSPDLGGRMSRAQDSTGAEGGKAVPDQQAEGRAPDSAAHLVCDPRRKFPSLSRCSHPCLRSVVTRRRFLKASQEPAFLSTQVLTQPSRSQ